MLKNLDYIKRYLGVSVVTAVTVVLITLPSLSCKFRPAAIPGPFTSGKAGFSVKIKYLTSQKQEECRYRVLGVFVLPGEHLEIKAVLPAGAPPLAFAASAGSLLTVSDDRCSWQAPVEKGRFRLDIIHPLAPDTMTLNIFVMVPLEIKTGYELNGYRIGKYPDPPPNPYLPGYQHKGLIEVTSENEPVAVSPHFTLGQFACSQAAGYPRYLMLQERLVLKLEYILAAVNTAGYPCRTLGILDGYHTPSYNAMIGEVAHSRHIWGEAADIIIDEEPADSRMDDLNGDDRLDDRDALVLYNIIDGLSGDPGYKPYLGGLGKYREHRNGQGPYLHVDVRGSRVRWGE